jgi:hypothetical protein
LNYSIVRPGTLTNDSQLENWARAKLNKHGEISRADVAQTLVQSLEDKTAHNATFEIIEILWFRTHWIKSVNKNIYYAV